MRFTKACSTNLHRFHVHQSLLHIHRFHVHQSLLHIHRFHVHQTKPVAHPPTYISCATKHVTYTSTQISCASKPVCCTYTYIDFMCIIACCTYIDFMCINACCTQNLSTAVLVVHGIHDQQGMRLHRKLHNKTVHISFLLYAHMYRQIPCATNLADHKI